MSAAREWVVLYKAAPRVPAVVWAIIADVPATVSRAGVEAALEAWPRWSQWQARAGVGSVVTVARMTAAHDQRGAEVVQWDALAPASKSVQAVVDGELYARLSRAARVAGVPLRTWLVQAIESHLASEAAGGAE